MTLPLNRTPTSPALTPAGIGAAAAAHTHAASVRTIAYAATLTIVATTGLPVDRCNITATGNITTLTPSGGVDGQIIRPNVLASGAARSVTVAGAVRLSTGISSRTIPIGSGQIAALVLEYSGLIGAWVLVGAAVSAT